MSQVLPQSREQLIAFAEAHYPIWLASTTIGITPAQAQAFKAAAEDARAKLNAALAARTASKAATTSYHGSTDSLRDLGSDLVAIIKAFAEASANPPAVYAAAQIPMPMPPSPLPLPSQPTQFAIGLNSDGSLSFKWKADNAAPSTGAYFTIQRRLAGQAGFMQIGTSSEKFFVDATLPFGTSQASYIVTGHRAGVPGPQSDQINLQFGVGGGGGGGAGVNFTVGDSAPQEVKMAA